jgi:UDP-GlcNAc:undecaprenyl-phosphate GlcNAc-1-phosphate transferase
LDINLLYYFPLLIVGVGFINAFNFMDGINGITGLYSMSILIILIIFNEYVVDFIETDLLIVLLFSVLVFLFYNLRKKALFFAGDVGSITMAICILFIVLKLYFKTEALVIVLLLAVYGVDSVLTIIRRIYMKEKITDAHRHHLYQKMVDSKKLTHIQTSFIYSIVQFFLGVLVYYSYALSMGYQISIIFLVLTILSIVYFRAIKYYSIKK